MRTYYESQGKKPYNIKNTYQGGKNDIENDTIVDSTKNEKIDVTTLMRTGHTKK